MLDVGYKYGEVILHQDGEAEEFYVASVLPPVHSREQNKMESWYVGCGNEQQYTPMSPNIQTAYRAEQLCLR